MKRFRSDFSRRKRVAHGKLPICRATHVMIINETTALSDAVRYVYMKVTLELRLRLALVNFHSKRDTAKRCPLSLLFSLRLLAYSTV